MASYFSYKDLEKWYHIDWKKSVVDINNIFLARGEKKGLKIEITNDGYEKFSIYVFKTAFIKEDIRHPSVVLKRDNADEYPYITCIDGRLLIQRYHVSSQSEKFENLLSASKQFMIEGDMTCVV